MSYQEEMKRMIDEAKETAYNKGLQDAWELANEINNMALREVHKIYGFSIHREELFSAVDAQEALDKMEAYKEKQKICVGDVVEHKDGISITEIERQEAIDWCKKFAAIDGCNPNHKIMLRCIEALEKVQTLEKKKPKKKNKVIYSHDSYAYCPHCKGSIEAEFMKPRNCRKCGGELDWS